MWKIHRESQCEHQLDERLRGRNLFYGLRMLLRTPIERVNQRTPVVPLDVYETWSSDSTSLWTHPPVTFGAAKHGQRILLDGSQCCADGNGLPSVCRAYFGGYVHRRHAKRVMVSHRSSSAGTGRRFSIHATLESGA